MVTRGPILLLLLSLAGLVLLIFRNDFPSIRFESELLNYSFALGIVLSLPISILWWVFKTFSGRVLWMGLALVAPTFAFILFFPVLFLYIDLQSVAETGQDSSFEKLDARVINGHRYCLYRTNGGATTSYGLVLRRESDSFLGMKIVRMIKSAYPASNAKLEVLQSGMARLVIEPYSAGDSVKNFEFQP